VRAADQISFRLAIDFDLENWVRFAETALLLLLGERTPAPLRAVRLPDPTNYN
jgi:hypothetical protein